MEVLVTGTGVCEGSKRVVLGVACAQAGSNNNDNKINLINEKDGFCIYALLQFPHHQFIQHGFGDLHGNHFPTHGDDTLYHEPFFDDDFASFELFHFGADLKFDTQRRWFVIINV